MMFPPTSSKSDALNPLPTRQASPNAIENTPEAQRIAAQLALLLSSALTVLRSSSLLHPTDPAPSTYNDFRLAIEGADAQSRSLISDPQAPLQLVHEFQQQIAQIDLIGRAARNVGVVVRLFTEEPEGRWVEENLTPIGVSLLALGQYVQSQLPRSGRTMDSFPRVDLEESLALIQQASDSLQQTTVLSRVVRRCARTALYSLSVLRSALIDLAPQQQPNSFEQPL